MQRSDEVEHASMFDDIPSASTDSSTDRADETATGSTDTATATNSTSRLGGMRRRLGSLFSVKLFLGTLLLAVVAMALGGMIPLVGFLGRFVGLFVVGFVVGVVATHRRYLEVATAGGVASGLGFLLSTLGSTFLPVAADLLARYGVALAGGGAVAGMLVAVAGHYFGRDLRDGLTRDIE